MSLKGPELGVLEDFAEFLCSQGKLSPEDAHMSLTQFLGKKSVENSQDYSDQSDHRIARRAHQDEYYGNEYGASIAYSDTFFDGNRSIHGGGIEEPVTGPMTFRDSAPQGAISNPFDTFAPNLDDDSAMYGDGPGPSFWQPALFAGSPVLHSQPIPPFQYAPTGIGLNDYDPLWAQRREFSGIEIERHKSNIDMDRLYHMKVLKKGDNLVTEVECYVNGTQLRAEALLTITSESYDDSGRRLPDFAAQIIGIPELAIPDLKTCRTPAMISRRLQAHNIVVLGSRGTLWRKIQVYREGCHLGCLKYVQQAFSLWRMRGQGSISGIFNVDNTTIVQRGEPRFTP